MHIMHICTYGETPFEAAILRASESRVDVCNRVDVWIYAMRVCICMYMYIRVDTFRSGDFARRRIPRGCMCGFK